MFTQTGKGGAGVQIQFVWCPSVMSGQDGKWASTETELGTGDPRTESISPSLSYQLPFSAFFPLTEYFTVFYAFIIIPQFLCLALSQIQMSQYWGYKSFCWKPLPLTDLSIVLIQLPRERTRDPLWLTRPAPLTWAGAKNSCSRDDCMDVP